MEFFENYWFIWAIAFIVFAGLTRRSKRIHAKTLSALDPKKPIPEATANKIEALVIESTLALIFFIMMCIGIALRIAAHF